jgi:hypothetical protein
VSNSFSPYFRTSSIKKLFGSEIPFGNKNRSGFPEERLKTGEIIYCEDEF